MPSTTLFLTQVLAVMALVMMFFSLLGWFFKKNQMDTARLSKFGGFALFFVGVAAVLIILFRFFSG